MKGLATSDVSEPGAGALTYAVERPPPGPAQGSVPAPAWAVVLLSIALAALAVFGLARAWRQRRP